MENQKERAEMGHRSYRAIQLKRLVFSTAFLGLLFLWLPATAAAVEVMDDESAKLLQRKVSLSIRDKPVSEAIELVCEQAGLGLAIRAPKTETGRLLTVQLGAMPAGEVLDVVLEDTGLSAKLKKGVLHVDSAQGTGANASAGTDAPKLLSPQVGAPPLAPPLGPLGKWPHHKHRAKGQSRVEFGNPVRIGADETVEAAISFGDSVTVAGIVREDVVSFGGSVFLEPGALVEGDAISFGGRVEVPPEATVKGDRVAFGFPPHISSNSNKDKASNFLPFALPGIVGGLSLMGVLALLLRSVLLFVVALIFVWLMPGRVNRVRDYLTEKPGYSVLGGLLLLMGFIPAIVLLAITIIGIPLIPVAVLAVLALIIMGLSALLTWLGHKVPLLGRNKGPVGAMLLGLLAFVLVSMIPIAGPVFLTLAAFVAAGAALLSRFGARKVEG